MTTGGLPPPDLIAHAVRMAQRSPCAKSKRGAVVYDAAAYKTPEGMEHPRSLAGRPRVLGAGHNGMPYPFACGGSCGKACSPLCMHAEQRAVRVAEREGHDLIAIGSCDLIHVKVVGGVLVAGGGPSCWECSKLVVESGIAAVWLYEEQPARPAPAGSGGIRPPSLWRRYPAIDFHIATARACELVGYRYVPD